MAKSGPFPNPQGKFNTYVNNAIPYLDSNKTRLKVPATPISKLLALHTQWKDIYPKSRDGNTRTSTVILTKNQLRKEITALLRKIYRDIPDSALTTNDRSTLTLKARKKKNAARPAIKERLHLSLRVEDGSIIKITCRRPTDEDRPSRHKHSDAIELKWVTAAEGPASPADCPNTVIFTRSISRLRLSQSLAGQRFWCYARWKNIRDDNKSGTWSRRKTAIISD